MILTPTSDSELCTCKHCKEEKLGIHFKSSRNKSGYSNICIQCKRKYYNDRYYSSEPDKRRTTKAEIRDGQLRCQRCGEFKSPSLFSKHPGTQTGFHTTCKPCINSRRRELHAQTPEKYIKHSLDNYYKNHERNKAINRMRLNKQAEDISDYYVRSIVSNYYGIPRKDVPTGLVEAKREIIKLKRAFKELSVN